MQQAAAVHRQLIGQVFSISSESQRMAFLQRIDVQYHAFLTLVWQLCSDSPAAVAAAFDLVLRRKGGAWSVAGMENPLLRSGLALAGANTWLQGRSVPRDAEDGILTVRATLTREHRRKHNATTAPHFAPNIRWGHKKARLKSS